MVLKLTIMNLVEAYQLDKRLVITGPIVCLPVPKGPITSDAYKRGREWCHGKGQTTRRTHKA